MITPNPDEKWSKAWRAFVKWFIFSAMISVLPLVIAFMMSPYREVDSDIGLKYVIGNGELLLIVVSFCAVSMGETASIKFEKTIDTVLVGANLVIVISAAAFYGNVVTTGQSSPEYDPDMVARLSLILFFCSCLVSAGIVILAALRED